MNTSYTFVYTMILMCKQLILDSIIKSRKEKGLTQKDMAEKLNISQSMYSRLETGSEEITLSRLQEILSILDVDIYQLLKVSMNEDNRDKILEVIKLQEQALSTLKSTI